MGQPEQMTPYQRATLELQRDRLNAQLDGRLNTAPTVNIGTDGKNYGSPPKDMAWARDESGQIRLDDRGVPIALPIAGTKLYADAQRTEEASGKRAEGTQSVAKLQVEEIRRAKRLIEDQSLLNPTTGFLGPIVAKWGGTDAADLSALLDTIGANISFDYLNQMRQQSPTGGALGNVTERELALLQATAGSLSQSQSAEQLVANLDRLEKQFAEIIHGPQASAAPAGDAPEGVDPELWEVMTPKERALWLN